MAQKHQDFVIYVRNGVEINALVAVSREVVTHATQEVPAFTTEHLTLVYLDPTMASPMPSGDQLRAMVATAFDVTPLAEGGVNGWKEVSLCPADGTEAPDETPVQHAESVEAEMPTEGYQGAALAPEAPAPSEFVSTDPEVVAAAQSNAPDSPNPGPSAPTSDEPTA